MNTCELDIEPTAWQCTICLDGEEDVTDEPVRFDQLVRYQEEAQTVIFAHFEGGKQYICEVCEEGHCLCRNCADALFEEHDRPVCPVC